MQSWTTPLRKKIEIDVKETFRAFKIMQWIFFLTFNIQINSILYIRNYYNSDGCEFFSPVTVTPEVNFPLFYPYWNIVCIKTLCDSCWHYVIVCMYCSNSHGLLCGKKKTPGVNRLYLPQYAECSKLASPYFLSLSPFVVQLFLSRKWGLSL